MLWYQLPLINLQRVTVIPQSVSLYEEKYDTVPGRCIGAMSWPVGVLGGNMKVPGILGEGSAEWEFQSIESYISESTFSFQKMLTSKYRWRVVDHIKRGSKF